MSLKELNYDNNFIDLTEDIAICNGDSIEVLKSIKSNSVDACITDPPYFIDGMGNHWDVNKLNDKTSKSGVVGSLPVGMKFDHRQGKDLQAFMEKISKEVYRILKPGGFYLSFSQGRLYHRMAVAMEDCGFEIRDMLIWKREGQAKAFSQEHFVRKMKLPDDEKNRIITSLNGRKTPQLKGTSEPIVLAQKPKDGTFVNNWMEYGVGLINTNVSLDGKFPATIMEVPKPSGKERSESSHLTMKPVTLMEHLVKVFTKESAVVCDPFLGSGSTGIACYNTGRKFIGIELDKHYFEETKTRMLNRFNIPQSESSGDYLQ